MSERRVDLENAPFSAPEFIAGKVLPVFTVSQPAGKLYFDDYGADTSAQVNRTSSTAITANWNDAASTNYACVCLESRQLTEFKQATMRGGKDACDARNARKGKRSIMNQIEDSVADALFGGDMTEVNAETLALPLTQAIAYCKGLVADKASGQIAIVASESLIEAMKQDYTVKDRMKYTGVVTQSAKDVRSVSLESLAAIFGVDQVLAGKNAYWATPVDGDDVSYGVKLAVMVLPDGSIDPDEDVQAGRLVVQDGFGENGDQPFKVSSFDADQLKGHVVDVEAYAHALILNPEAVVVLVDTDEIIVEEETESSSESSSGE
jgi:hypothetical protein